MINENNCPFCGVQYQQVNGRLMCVYCNYPKTEELPGKLDHYLVDIKSHLENFEFEAAGKTLNTAIHEYPDSPEIYFYSLMQRNHTYFINYGLKRFPVVCSESFAHIRETEDYKQLMNYSKGEKKDWFNYQIAFIENQKNELIKFQKTNEIFDIFIDYEKIDDPSHTDKIDKLIGALNTRYGYKVFRNEYSVDDLSNPCNQAKIQYALNVCSTFIFISKTFSAIRNIESSGLLNNYSKKINNGNKHKDSLIFISNGYDENEFGDSTLPGKYFDKYWDKDKVVEYITERITNFRVLSDKNNNKMKEISSRSLKERKNLEGIQTIEGLNNTQNTYNFFTNEVIGLKYYSDSNDETKKHVIDNAILTINSQIKQGKFQTATSLISDFMRNNCLGNEELPIDILIQLLLVKFEATDIDILFEYLINEKENKDKNKYFLNVITKLQIGHKTSEEFLEKARTYVSKMIFSNNLENAFDVYSLIYNIDHDIIKDFNYNYLKKTIFNKDDYIKLSKSIAKTGKTYLYEFIMKAISTIHCLDNTSDNEIENQYKSISQYFSNVLYSLIDKEMYLPAEELSNEYIKINSNNPFAYIYNLEAQLKINDDDKLLESIENNYSKNPNIFKKYGEIIRKLKPEDRDRFILKIVERIRFLFNSKNRLYIKNWIDIIINYNFNNKKQIFTSFMELCLKPYDEYSYTIFNTSLSVFNNEDREDFINMSLIYSKEARKKDDFEHATIIIRNAIDIEPNDQKLAKELLLINTFSKTEYIDDIGSLKTIDIVEDVLHVIDSIKEKNKFLNDLIVYSINNISELDKNINLNIKAYCKNMKDLFNLLNDNTINDRETKFSKMIEFSEKLCSIGQFQHALDFVQEILYLKDTENISYHRACWCTLLATQKAKSDYELRKVRNLAKEKYFKEALLYSAKNDINDNIRYSNVAEGLDNKKKKKNLFLILIFLLYISFTSFVI